MVTLPKSLYIGLLSSTNPPVTFGFYSSRWF